MLEAETDKATMEVESAISGRLDQVLCQADEEVSVGQVIAVFDVADSTPSASIATADVRRQRPLAQPVVAACRCAATGRASKPVGMFARNRAAASGRESAGRQSSADASRSARQPGGCSRASRRSRTSTCRRLSTPRRSSHAARPPNRCKLAWDAFFVRAVAKAISRFDRFRCRFDGEQLVPADCDAIGVAIDVDNELFVIPVHGAGGQDGRADLGGNPPCGRASAERRSGVRRIHSALMTVTNLGGCNVESFVPIINPPEAAILGVGKVMLTPVVQDNGQLVAQHRGTLTLCVDHRVASGKYAAEFLGAIVEELETR